MQIHQELRLSTLVLSNFATGGVIGTAAATVDSISAYAIGQTTAGQSLSFPTPSNTTGTLKQTVSNTGTSDFAMQGAIVKAGTTVVFNYVSGVWQVQSGAVADFYLDGGKANTIMTGGGTVTYDTSGNLLWTQRFIIIGGGASNNSSVYSTAGYYDITMPPVGTVIPALGNATSVTVTAAGISMTSWGALYYKLTPGGNGTQNGNFIYVGYAGGNYTVTPDMVLVAAANRDNPNSIRLGTGQTMTGGDTIIIGKPQDNWARTGSAGTTASPYNDNGVAQTGNYIGTRDNVPLVFYTNGASATNNKASAILNTATATTGGVTPPVDIFIIRRNGVTSVTYPNAASFALGRHSAAGGTAPQTQLDIRLSNGSVYTPDVTVMSLLSNGRVVLPLAQPNYATTALAIADTTLLAGTLYTVTTAGAKALFIK